jgi:peptide/nickel transport system substrate-binding protein
VSTTVGLGGCLGGDRRAGSSGGSRGEWYTPDGERFRVRIVAPSNGTWPLNAQTAAETLISFGIDAQTELKEFAAYGKDVRTGDFDLAVNNWGIFGPGGRHPHTFYSEEYAPSLSEEVGIDPTAVEVPMPVGDQDGDVQTIDVQSKIRSLARASSGESERRLVEELAWIYNQHLPRLPLMTGVARSVLTEDDWEIPATDSRWMRDNPAYTLPRLARIESSPDSDDDALTFATRRANPNDMQWNPYFTQASNREPAVLMAEPPLWTGVYSNDVDASDFPEYTPILAEDYSVTDGTLVLDIESNRVWTDGDPVTAEDLLTQYRIAKFLGQKSGDVWDSVERRGRHTLAFDIGQRNPGVVVPSLLGGNIEIKRDSRFGGWLEETGDATTEEEADSIREEIVTTRIDETESFSLWALDSVTSNRVVLHKHEEHPLAERIDYETIELESISNNQTRWESLKEDLLDGIFVQTAPESIQEEFPDHARVIAYDSPAGDAVYFNHATAPFDDRNVRRAIAYLINRRTNANNAKDFVTTIEVPTGMANRENEQYLEGALEQYERYGFDRSRTDRAASILESAGFTRE